MPTRPKLSISNIGWPEAVDADVYPQLSTWGCDALDIAPGRVLGSLNLSDINQQDLDAIRQRLDTLTGGLPIIGMQSLLYGYPNLRLFEAAQGSKEWMAHFENVFKLGQALGVRCYVFGSPKNRLKQDLSFDQAVEQSMPLLKQTGDLAASYGGIFCLEPNAKDYGCDFMTTVSQTCAVIKAVDHPAVRMNLDLGVCLMNENANEETVKDELLREYLQLTAHAHISVPFLETITNPDYCQRLLFWVRRLITHGYSKVLAIEMLPPKPESKILPVEAVSEAISMASQWLNHAMSDQSSSLCQT